ERYRDFSPTRLSPSKWVGDVHRAIPTVPSPTNAGDGRKGSVVPVELGAPLCRTCSLLPLRDSTRLRSGTRPPHTPPSTCSYSKPVHSLRIGPGPQSMS